MTSHAGPSKEALRAEIQRLREALARVVVEPARAGEIARQELDEDHS